MNKLYRKYLEWQYRKIDAALKALPAEKAALITQTERSRQRTLIMIEHEAARRLLEGTQRLAEITMELRT